MLADHYAKVPSVLAIASLPKVHLISPCFFCCHFYMLPSLVQGRGGDDGCGHMRVPVGKKGALVVFFLIFVQEMTLISHPAALMFSPFPQTQRALVVM